MKNNVFTGHFKIWLSISGIIVLAAIVMSLFGAGMNMGIDFTGGSLLEYEMGQAFEISDVEEALRQQGVAEYQIAKAGTEQTQLQVRVKLIEDSDDMRLGFEEALMEKYPDMSFITISHVGAVAGQDLIRNAILSMLIVFACLLVYIAIRFDFYSGLAALVALLHDMLIMMSFMVFFSSLYQVNSSFIAAMLTIVGYSINNTIIIFDRIRDSKKMSQFFKDTNMAIVEYSVSRTITRTLNTTITTLLTLVTLYVLGVDSIKEFAFPLIIGMLAGTYSSVLLSGQIWATWRDNNTFGKLASIFRKEAKA
ncbi:MAG: protein translocase subunit SecF [Clostridia bacterium]|nr:protein translocase subunit SecF [Clostridia bacterium]